MSLELNTLYYGDCLDWMTRWDDACVDLIYLDPPFNSNANYNILYSVEGGGQAQYRAFDDTWHWDEAAADRYARYEAAAGRPAHDVVVGLHRIIGPSGMLAYLTYMAERLEQMHRLLKPTGSIYLHCDPTASHYLKLLLDAIFGAGNFRSEIIWKRSHSHNSAKRYGPIHDVIFFYTKSDTYTWTGVRQPYDPDYVNRYFKFDDDDGRGRYWTGDLTGSGTRNGETGKEWRGFNPTAKRRHWMVARLTLMRSTETAAYIGRQRRALGRSSNGIYPRLKGFHYRILSAIFTAFRQWVRRDPNG